MINNYFTIQFTNYRQGGYVNGISSREEVGSFYGHLQQTSAELVENLGMSFTSAFTLWCPIDTDLETGDSLEDESNTYSVRAINKKNYGGSNQHLEVFIEKDVDNN